MAHGAAKSTVALVSGGLDSAVLLAELLRRGHGVVALSFDYGAAHGRRELRHAARLCRRLGVRREVVKLDFMARLFRSGLLEGGDRVPLAAYDAATMRSTVVPFRNGIMAAIAAGLAESGGAQAVAIAVHGGAHDLYPDCGQRFLHHFNLALRHGTYARIKLLRPFAALDKGGIVRLGAELGVDFAATWSCYRGGEHHCGACGTCRERRAAFRAADVADPTRYQATPPLGVE